MNAQYEHFWFGLTTLLLPCFLGITPVCAQSGASSTCRGRSARRLRNLLMSERCIASVSNKALLECSGIVEVFCRFQNVFETTFKFPDGRRVIYDILGIEPFSVVGILNTSSSVSIVAGQRT